MFDAPIALVSLVRRSSIVQVVLRSRHEGDVLWHHSDGTIVAGGCELGLAPAGDDSDSDILCHSDGGDVLTWELENESLAAHPARRAAHLADRGNRRLLWRR